MRRLRISFRSLSHTIAILMALGLVSASLGVAPAGAEDKAAITLQIAVKADSEQAAIAAALKLDAIVVMELPPARSIFLVERVDLIKPSELSKKTDEFASKLEGEPGVQWAVPYDENVGGTRFFAWNETPRLGLDAGSYLDEYLDLPSAHAIATGAGVTVALIDTGFDLDHPLLESRFLPGIDLVDGHQRPSDWKNGIDEDGDGVADESHGHGTFVAGLIAQVAPGANMIPIRAMEADGVGDMHVIIDAIDEAVARDADIINISFGTDTDSEGLKDAIKRAQDSGVVIVAAAGNHGSEDKRFPAAYSGVIAVGAFASEADGIAAWGAYGDWVDVSAPGSEIVSAKPGGGMATWSGSSISAPIVAGQVALLIEVDAKKGTKDAEKLVKDTAKKSNGSQRSKGGFIQLEAALLKLG